MAEPSRSWNRQA